MVVCGFRAYSGSITVTNAAADAWEAVAARREQLDEVLRRCDEIGKEALPA